MADYCQTVRIGRLEFLKSLLLLCGIAVSCAGCSESGPKLGTVTGTVTCDGKPLDQAMVVFQPPQGRAAIGVTNDEGQYELKFTIERTGAMLGPNKVFITSQVEDANGNVVRKEFLPERYHRQSDLSANVDAGNNVFNFDLTST